MSPAERAAHEHAARSYTGGFTERGKDRPAVDADLLDDVGAGRLTPGEAQTISAIVAKRAELFASVELASEIEALKVQLAAVVGAPRPPSPIRRPFAINDLHEGNSQG